MFNNLSERLDSAFKLLKGEGRISEINIATTLKEIRRALVDADVNFKIAKEFNSNMVVFYFFLVDIRMECGLS